MKLTWDPVCFLFAFFVGLTSIVGPYDVVAQGTCRDLNRNCPTWRRYGYCRTNRYTRSNCRQSCGLCPRVTVQLCNDRHVNCGYWGRIGQCRLNPRYMLVYCKKSCGRCGGVRPKPTKVNGAWSKWSRWTPCSKTCGKGIMRRMRTCSSPRPKNGGRNCVGASSQQQLCNTMPCPTKAPTTVPTNPAPTTPSGAGYTCGQRSASRIVGGSKASPRDWPWQVGLKRADNPLIFCGGSLLNHEWVVTAAHCIFKKFNPSRRGCVKPDPKLIVVLGEFDVNNIEGHEVHKEVSLMCMHPQYDSSILDYDITLLKFKTPLKKFNEYMSPICLPRNNTILRVGTSCYVTGFGRTSEHGFLSTHLREAQVPVISRKLCTKRYSGRRHKVTSRMICAGHAQGGIDSCKGDSGGPFVCKGIVRRGDWTLMGVVSWGVGCARGDKPGVYADVRDFVDWIDITTQTV